MRQDTLLLTWFVFSGHLCSKRRCGVAVLMPSAIAPGLPHTFLRGDLCLLLPFACIPFTSERLSSSLGDHPLVLDGQGSILILGNIDHVYCPAHSFIACNYVPHVIFTNSLDELKGLYQSLIQVSVVITFLNFIHSRYLLIRLVPSL